MVILEKFYYLTLYIKRFVLLILVLVTVFLFLFFKTLHKKLSVFNVLVSRTVDLIYRFTKDLKIRVPVKFNFKYTVTINRVLY